MTGLAWILGGTVVATILLTLVRGMRQPMDAQRLTPGFSGMSRDAILGAQDAAVRQFVQDEGAFTQGHFSARAWERRRRFLFSQYLDLARALERLDKRP